MAKKYALKYAKKTMQLKGMCGKAHSTRNCFMHGSETWPVKNECEVKLEMNEVCLDTWVVLVVLY